MKVVIHDRTEALPPGLRDYTERKLERLVRHFDRVQLVQVDFEPEAKRAQDRQRVVRILVETDTRKGPDTIVAQVKAADPQAALDLALDKADRQLRRLKEKMKVHKAKGPAEDGLPAEASAELGPERLQVRLKPESLDHAEASLDANGLLFHVFLNEDSGEINVIYRRRDGSLAILEPLVP